MTTQPCHTCPACGHAQTQRGWCGDCLDHETKETTTC